MSDMKTNTGLLFISNKVRYAIRSAEICPWTRRRLRRLQGVMAFVAAAYLHEKLNFGLVCVAHLPPVNTFAEAKREDKKFAQSFESEVKRSSGKAGSSAHIFRYGKSPTQPD